MTRKIDPSQAKAYLTKAEQFLATAQTARANKEYTSSVITSIHSAINALDALTTFYLSQRSSGQHTDVLILIKPLFTDRKEYDAIKKQFSSLESLKNESEYQPNLMNSTDADNSIRNAERILEKVKKKLSP